MTVTYDTDGPVAVISINRPASRNAEDADTALALYATFEAFDANDELTVAVFTGTGCTFCAGADLRSIAEGNTNTVRETGDLAHSISHFPQRCMRGDRLSALEQWDLSEPEACRNKTRRGLATLASGETVSGASDFSQGKGRHDSFDPA